MAFLGQAEAKERKNDRLWLKLMSFETDLFKLNQVSKQHNCLSLKSFISAKLYLTVIKLKETFEENKYIKIMEFFYRLHDETLVNLANGLVNWKRGSLVIKGKRDQ